MYNKIIKFNRALIVLKGNYHSLNFLWNDFWDEMIRELIYIFEQYNACTFMLNSYLKGI